MLNGNEVSSHEKDVEECTLVIERSQSEKATYCRILTTWHSGKGTARGGKRIRGCQGLGAGKDG